MKNKLSLILAALFLVTFCTTSFAALKFNMPNSMYRKIDKTGSTSPYKSSAKVVIKGVGIGNIIFAPSNLDFDAESSYAGVGTSFTADQIKANFQARAYFPARIKDIIAYVEAKNPGYKFNSNTIDSEISVEPPDGLRYSGKMMPSALQGGASSDLDDESLVFDQYRSWLTPNNESSFRSVNIEQLVMVEPGTYKVTISHFLNFDTGKGKYVSKYDRSGNLVTEWVPNIHGFLIATGSCTITN
ncbi:hypothetical protein A2311_00965 [candidate division WOR-1 bacterium RIFOXYB2_FULL_48_7]|uniref:Gingipain propeptide domain-containing protein n=1 Tax=candidate division WOR-1 bacterium RIFOXYB2_FULL_48_7 TaxID=1802583 RepID=A0A1F4TQ64_UNCSA|nr:MAG: hypothetical protein A2311_00965 [candidate division WOR-1 bacterium RIFOXYB2_FULL_48_7]